MPRYLILPGGRFRMPDGSVKEAGDHIDLEADVAAMHPGTVVLAPDEPSAAAPLGADQHQE